ncbi:MAG: response regulator [Woeseiaceae bacterium]|nr:response regulator [Woeseiaceae bacterium]
MNAPDQHLVFLDDLGSATRELVDPGEIMEVTSRRLGRYLGVSRAAYADVWDDNDTFVIRHDYVDGCDSSVGTYRLDQFGPRAAGAMRGGDTLIIRDVDAELAPGAGNEAFRGISVQAIICCPLVKSGRLLAMMAVHQVEPRDWRDDEVALVSRVAERSWATIERERLQEQLQQALRLETVGQLAGGVAHDFNNLLTVINATAELLLDRVAVDDEMRHDLGTILRAGEQATSMTRQLLALSHQQVMNPVTVDLNAVLSDMEPMLQRLVGENVTVRLRPAADAATVRVDRTQIDQVLLNLGLNSRDAMPEGGTLVLETSNVQLDASSARQYENLEPGPHAVITVSDTGTGMDEATQRRIFEPFFTTKGPGKGTGLGLPTVRGIVEQSGGSLTVNSEPGKGTTVRIFLPRIAGDNARPDADVQQALLGSETVLVVEDEQEIRQVSRTMLERRGYNVLTAASGEEAVSIVEQGENPPDLVLCDVVMPGMNGPETVRQLRAIRPEINVLYMSGYAADPDCAARRGRGTGPLSRQALYTRRTAAAPCAARSGHAVGRLRTPGGPVTRDG